MAYRAINAIEVLCWGQKVGVIAPHPQRNFFVFEYYPEFLTSGIELSPKALPLSLSTPVFFSSLSRETYCGLPAFIADSLPDSFGNGLIDSWMQQQGLSKDEITVLDRLAYMGSRGMGALEFKPAIERQKVSSSALQMKDIVEAARRGLKLGKEFYGVPADAAMMQLIQVGTSAGGAKAKAVIGYNPASKKIVSGQFALPKGYEHWLLKINASEDGGRDFGRIEYAYHLMACACGITMAASTVLEIAGRMHFMTQRFDRGPNNEKVHIQTLCALSELDYNQRATHDYVQLFQTAEELGLGYEAADEIFDRMVFNVCAANNDDHTKNHSFMLEQNGAWQLAPAYDLMHAHKPGNVWLDQHLMGVSGIFRDIGQKPLLALGQRFNVSNPQKRIDHIIETVMHWPEFAQEVGLSESETQRVFLDIEACCATASTR